MYKVKAHKITSMKRNNINCIIFKNNRKKRGNKGKKKKIMTIHEKEEKFPKNFYQLH